MELLNGYFTASFFFFFFFAPSLLKIKDVPQGKRGLVWFVFCVEFQITVWREQQFALFKTGSHFLELVGHGEKHTLLLLLHRAKAGGQ